MKLLSASDHKSYDTLLIALPRSTRMHRFISHGSELHLTPGAVLLGQGLADTLAITVGDRVLISDSDTGIQIEEPVAGFVDEPTSPVA
ncbi:MAG: hypothetical protein ACM4D3_05195 [Candidatus Sericytochromatia bacterium]